MEFMFAEMIIAPSESYSRQLDKHVALEEKPYGYMTPPPPADTGDYDQAALESHCGRSRHKGYRE